MNKRHAFIAILIASAYLFLMPVKGYTAITNGLQWLTSVQQADGSWGNWTEPVIRDTTTVADAFQILDPTSPAYFTALQWLAAQEAINYDYASRKINTFAKTNNDISLELNYLLTGQRPNGGWGIETEHESSNFDTSLSLLALKAANYTDSNIISSALGYLISTQNPDGGFGFYSGDDSNVYMTAIVLKTLSSYKGIFNVQSSINNAAAYLLTKQNPDGGFGSPSSTVYETALAIIALINSGQGQALPLQNAVNYLTTTQSPDGSWNQDPYSTALAIRALANEKPNLSITSGDIYFSNPAPTVGETITITANIKNTGPLQANNVVVQFYDGDPNAGGIQIG